MALNSMTLASAGFLMLLTSLPVDKATASQVLAVYRLRWQVELAFKWLKSGLGMDRLLARDPAMARSWLLSHLILALLIEDGASEVLESPPSAPGWPFSSRFAMAPACRSEVRTTWRHPETYPACRPSSGRSRHCPAHLRPTTAARLPIDVLATRAPGPVFALK
jgi:hypothetical protein